jgi:DNA-directed RNA polymerase subunit RPC12/RpoP
VGVAWREEPRMTWICKRCGADVEDDLPFCWQCGTSHEGEPPPAGWQSELAASSKPEPRELMCLRCETRLESLGKKRFHEGSYTRDVLLGDLFVHRAEFDVYVCPRCGKAEFFTTHAAS